MQRLAADEQRGSKAAGRVDAHAGDVNAGDVDGDQGDADGQSGKPRGGAFLRGAKNDHHENQRGDKLKQDGGGHVVAALVAGAPAILAQAAGGDVVTAGDAARR